MSIRSLALRATIASCAALAVVSSTVYAQAVTSPSTSPEIGKVEQVTISTKLHRNQGPSALLVDERIIRRPGAGWLQVEFGEYRLSAGSWIELMSMKDNQVQVLDATKIANNSNFSYYYNGDALRVRLYAGANTSEQFYQIKSLGVGLPAAQVIQTLCGSDNRARSNDRRVARIILRRGTSYGWCTAWLISRTNCFSTAGHCLAVSGLTLVTAQFNVPSSTSTGSLVFPSTIYQYNWLGSSSTVRRYQNSGAGNDWGVFKTRTNTSTGFHAGVAQGSYFLFSSAPSTNTSLRVTGHGTDTSPKSYNGTQQTSTGPYSGRSGNRLLYKVDTMGGNSGSPVMITSTGRAIGVHTHGGCTSTGGANSGTYQAHTSYASARAALCRDVEFPALTPTFLSSSKTLLTPSLIFSMTGTVKNIGQSTSPAANNSFVFSPNSIISTIDTILGTFSSSSLKVNQSYTRIQTVRAPSSLANGTCYLGLYADRSLRVIEKSESNNTRALRVTCSSGARPDLRPIYLTASTSLLTPLKIFSMTSRIYNGGTATSPSCTSGHYLSTNNIISTADTLLGSFTTVSLVRLRYHQVTQTVRAPSSLPNATCYVGAYADRLFRVSELSESNNGLARSVTCRNTGKPDLVVTALSLSSSSAVSAGSIRVTTSTKNIGTATAAANYTGIMLSSNTIISTGDYYLGYHYNSTLAANQTRTVTVTHALPNAATPRTWYVGAWADYNSRVSESSETNNFRTVAVRIVEHSTRLALVQFRPLLNTMATSETFASGSTRTGGTAWMCVSAPGKKGHWALCAWSASSSWRFDSLSGFSLSLLNSPVFPLWFTRLSSVDGRAYPRFNLPRIAISSSFNAYTKTFFFTPTFSGLSGASNNVIRTSISR